MPEFHAQFQSAELEFRILKLLSRDSSLALFGANSASPASARSAADETEVPIYCSLYHKFHEEKPSYKALSYTWGDPNDTIAILVDEHEHGVTKNLFAALQHIRQDQEDVHIWIDALCINQHDDAEKSEQVKKMKDIYFDAAETIVWLGPSDDSTEETISELNRIGNFIFESGILDQMIRFAMLSGDDQEGYRSGEKEIKDSVSVLLDVAENDLPKTEKLLRGLQTLQARPYWERVWILQEIVVSPNVLIRVGNSTLPFSYFHGAHMYLSCMSAWIVQPLHARLVSLLETAPESEEFTQGYEMFMKICNIGQIKSPGRIAGMRRNRQLFLNNDSSANVPPKLTQLLAKVFIDNTPKATNDKDRIYALLGMASDFEALQIEPDYSPATSCIGVYIQVAKALISRGDIDVLSFTQYPANEKREGPSWVPDWKRTIRRPSGQLPWDTSFSVSGNQTFSSFLPDNTTLLPSQIKLSGFIIDKVQTLASTPWAPITEGVTKLHKEVSTHLSEIITLCQLSDSNLESDGKDPYPNPEDRHSAHYRIPVADQEEYGIGFVRRATSDLYPAYVAVVRDLERNGITVEIPAVAGGEGVVEKPETSGRYYNVLSWQRSRHAFMSEKGFVGLGPHGIKKGDLVVAFRGAKFAYVLSELKEQGQGEEPVYELRGEAYVHGIMYGEFFPAGSDESNEMEERGFILV